MRSLLFSVCVTLAACGSNGGACPSGPNGQDCAADLATADLRCAGDLAGTPLQICGGPDASFSPALCKCLGDP